MFILETFGCNIVLHSSSLCTFSASQISQNVFVILQKPLCNEYRSKLLDSQVPHPVPQTGTPSSAYTESVKFEKILVEGNGRIFLGSIFLLGVEMALSAMILVWCPHDANLRKRKGKIRKRAKQNKIETEREGEGTVD